MPRGNSVFGHNPNIGFEKRVPKSIADLIILNPSQGPIITHIKKWPEGIETF